MRAVVITAACAGLAAAAAMTLSRDRRPTPPVAAIGSAGTLSTSRDALQSVVSDMRRRTEADPGDGGAAVLLADALMRTARVEGDASLPLEAERVIRKTLAHDPSDYPSQRMLGVVLLSQHRFADALAAAQAAQRVRPDDAWNYAVIGDAALELGRYDEAFDAYDEVNRRRPDASAYARVAYARELQGEIAGAVDAMTMAVEATGPHDPEAQAWYLAQLGNLQLLAGQQAAAERAFDRAEFTFPGHPYARQGRVRAMLARGDHRAAYTLLASGPDNPETWALRGDIARRLGDLRAAEGAYREAERLERDGWQQEEPQPAALARFFAERRLKIAEAVTLAEQAAAHRRDIYTMDALAWAHFQAGNLEQAAKAIAAATRTGTKDPKIRCHAEAIAAASRDGIARHQAACEP